MRDEQQEEEATSSTYEATLPDGTVVRKKSSDVHQETAVLGCWEFRAKWFAGMIYAETKTPPQGTGLTFVEAKRLTMRADRSGVPIMIQPLNNREVALIMTIVSLLGDETFAVNPHQVQQIYRQEMEKVQEAQKERDYRLPDE